MAQLSLVFAFLVSTNTLATPVDFDWSNAAADSKTESFSEASALIEAEKFSEALPLLTSLAETEPESADVFNLLGYARRKLGELELSGLDYERALWLDPDHRGALEYQGELFLLLGDVDKAEANLAHLEKVCPDDCEEAEELAEAIALWRKEAPE